MRNYLLAFACFFLIGCASAPPPSIAPFSVNTEVLIGKQVNPYGGVEFHSLVLRLYQLKEPGLFQSSGFLDLYLDDRKQLAATLVDVIYLDPLLPGEYPMTFDIQRSSRYYAVLAEFANYKNAESKAILKLSEKPDQQIITVTVNGLAVTIESRPKPQKSWWQF